MPPKSDIWRYFTKVSAKDAKCNVCGRILQTSGNTSNMKGHLKRHQLKKEISCNVVSHKNSTSIPVLTISPEKHMEEETDSSTPMQSESMQYPKPRSTNTSTSTIPQILSGTQPSIVRSFADVQKFAEGGSRHCKITQALIQFICTDCMPLSLVEGTGFKNLMKAVVPLYKIPSRNTVKSMILKKYELLKSNIVMMLPTVQNLSMTVDVWSEMMTTTSFLGVTLHFIDNIELQSISLGVTQLHEPHTADYLGKQILAVLSDWGIPKEKIHSIVTDNEAAMVKAIGNTFGRNKHISCLAHNINLLAETAINNAEGSGLNELIKKVRDIVIFIKRSVNCSDQLRKEQERMGIKEGDILKLIQDVKTRWNSKYYMLERFIVLSNIISSILLSRPESPPMLSAIELENIKEVRGLLGFLENLTKEISGSTYVTSSLTIPLLNCLIQSIKGVNPKLKIGASLKQCLEVEFESRFKDREHAHLLALPTFLDVRFKNIHFSDPVASSRTLTQVKKLVATISGSPITTQGSSSSDSETEQCQDIWAHHKSLALKLNKKMTVRDSNLDNEISMYLSTPVAATIKANPLQLWEDIKLVYPKLYLIAQQYLGGVATSVPAERLFSKAANTITEKRNRLSGSLLSKLLFLNGLPEKYFM